MKRAEAEQVLLKLRIARERDVLLHALQRIATAKRGTLAWAQSVALAAIKAATKPAGEKGTM